MKYIFALRILKQMLGYHLNMYDIVIQARDYLKPLWSGYLDNNAVSG